MRGLKLENEYKQSQYHRRIFSDAWIETVTTVNTAIVDEVASFTDAWIETQVKWGALEPFSRIFYRCVD